MTFLPLSAGVMDAGVSSAARSVRLADEESTCMLVTVLVLSILTREQCQTGLWSSISTKVELPLPII